MVVSSISSNVESLNVEGYKDFKLVDLPWLPEALEDSAAFKALISDIETNGLRQPIAVDENDQVWDGRLRYLACKKLGLSLLVRRIKATDGEAVAQSGLVGREMTILDEVKLVGFIDTQLVTPSGKPCGRDELAKHMKSKFGWQRRSSGKQMDHYRELVSALPKLTPEKIAEVRSAETVNKARKSLGLVSKAKKSGSMFTIKKVGEKLAKILGHARKDFDQKKILAELEGLLMSFPGMQTKLTETKSPKGKSKKAESAKAEPKKAKTKAA